MFDRLKQRSSEVATLLLLAWALIASGALSQKVAGLNVLPSHLEQVAKILIVDFTIIVIVWIIISLQVHLAQIATAIDLLAKRHVVQPPQPKPGVSESND